MTQLVDKTIGVVFQLIEVSSLDKMLIASIQNALMTATRNSNNSLNVATYISHPRITHMASITPYLYISTHMH